MLDSTTMVQKLKDVLEGARLFVSYQAGRPPTPRAIREAHRAQREGFPRRYFVGRFHRLWTTQNGETVLTVKCENRDNELTGEQEAYRTFNPSLGQMLVLEVLQ